MPGRAFGSLRELDLSKNSVRTDLKVGRLQPLLGQLTMLGLEELTFCSEVGAYSLLTELEESAANMHEFRLGFDAPTAGVAACVQRCLASWPLRSALAGGPHEWRSPNSSA